MSSIKSSLVKQLTLIISLILFLVLLFLDISVDTYVERQFEHALVQEGKTLVNLINVKNGEASLSLHTELMDEFKEQKQGTYFQIWSDNHIIEKSASLADYPDFEIPEIKLISNEYLIKNFTLPDNRAGRIFIYNVGDAKKYNAHYKGDIYLGLAKVSESLENILILIDVVFLLTAIATTFFIRYLVNKIVSRGLKPIEKLNQQIRDINFNDESARFGISAPPEEIKTIIDELNQFLIVNRSLLQSEQRLTSDIAHELKTPIAELISVTEIAIKYPENEEVLATFKDDVISISLRMKNIVNSLLMFNKTNSQQFTLSTEKIDLVSQLQCLMQRFQNTNHKKKDRIKLEGPSLLFVQSDQFCIDAILTNLIDNALYYSPKNSLVNIKVQSMNDQTILSISNQLSGKMDDEDLNCMFEPLWQKDKSRTSEQHFGLGLSIVKRLCSQMDIELSVHLQPENIIEFRLVFGNTQL
jgi:signal transduction histidine kinase